MRRALMLLSLLVLGAASPALAQDLREAQRLFERGVAMADSDRWGEAAEYFRQARAIVERPSIVCNLGVALHHAGAVAEATEALGRCRELAEIDPEWGRGNAALVGRAARLLDELSPAMGSLTLTLAPPDAHVLLDGTSVPGTGSPRTIAVNPGGHTVTVSAPGHSSFHGEIVVLSGDAAARTIRLEPLPARPAILVVESLEGAQIFVDDLAMGTAGTELSLPAGSHTVRVEALGQEPLERDVVLAEGERATIDARFPGRSGDLASEPGLWIGIGGGVVAIGVAIALAVVLAQPSDPLANYDGSTGVVLLPLVSF